jgi:hypothetical protein
MENRIIDAPAELDDRDLDLVSGGWSGDSVSTTQVGLVNLSDVNVLSGIGIGVLGIGAGSAS